VELLQQDTTSPYGAYIFGIHPGDSQNKLDALTDFVFALGIGTFAPATPPHTLYEYLMGGGTDPDTIKNDFMLYDNPGTPDQTGLRNRRYDEALMYLSGEYVHTPAPAGTFSSDLSDTACGTA
jgi:GH24 family phage-related lysozyme (muramidase)